jgi:hypothetical protein
VLAADRLIKVQHRCEACGIAFYDREIQLQFEHDAREPGLDMVHLHVRCFAAWELERRRAPA